MGGGGEGGMNTLKLWEGTGGMKKLKTWVLVWLGVGGGGGLQLTENVGVGYDFIENVVGGGGGGDYVGKIWLNM